MIEKKQRCLSVNEKQKKEKETANKSEKLMCKLSRASNKGKKEKKIRRQINVCI